jgi:hypothetical protein
MTAWLAALDAACAWVNPGLGLVAVAVALLDLAAAAQRWTVMRADAPAQLRVVTVPARAAGCPPELPPALRDMVGRD